jgi:hypothetical protein
VQNQAFLYATKGKTAPFDVPGNEIGQLSSAPMNQTLHMSVFQTPIHFQKSVELTSFFIFLDAGLILWSFTPPLTITLMDRGTLLVIL